MPGQAQEDNGDELIIKLCTKEAQFAGELMSLRQDGFPLEDMTALFTDSGDMTKMVAVNAYKTPIQATRAGKEAAATAYAEHVRIVCFNAYLY